MYPKWYIASPWWSQDLNSGMFMTHFFFIPQHFGHNSYCFQCLLEQHCPVECSIRGLFCQYTCTFQCSKQIQVYAHQVWVLGPWNEFLVELYVSSQMWLVATIWDSVALESMQCLVFLCPAIIASILCKPGGPTLVLISVEMSWNPRSWIQASQLWPTSTCIFGALTPEPPTSALFNGIHTFYW